MGLNLLDITFWWLALEVVGLMALPIALCTGANLKDNGYSISNPLGLLLLTYIGWMLSVFGFAYNSLLVFLSLGIMGACSLIIFWSKRPLFADKNYIIKFEILFLVAFMSFAV